MTPDREQAQELGFNLHGKPYNCSGGRDSQGGFCLARHKTARQATKGYITSEET